jgi:adenylate cyclase
MSKPQRKLTTILATDCVNYSGMMEDNEQETFIGIKACRKIIEDTIKEYDGRVFNTAGDSVIAEFNSPVDCVNSAIEFQQLIGDRNKNFADNRQMKFRVGVHLDDVIVEGDDIFGGGVNISARLEGLCEPNCILISKAVHEYIVKKVNTIIEHMGERNLKNMDDSISVYQILKSN